MFLLLIYKKDINMFLLYKAEVEHPLIQNVNEYYRIYSKFSGNIGLK